jgi:hypothetical protein
VSTSIELALLGILFFVFVAGFAILWRDAVHPPGESRTPNPCNSPLNSGPTKPRSTVPLEVSGGS